MHIYITDSHLGYYTCVSATIITVVPTDETSTVSQPNSAKCTSLLQIVFALYVTENIFVRDRAYLLVFRTEPIREDVETPFLNFLRYGLLNHTSPFIVVSEDVETPFLNFLCYVLLNHTSPFIVVSDVETPFLNFLRYGLLNHTTPLSLFPLFSVINSVHESPNLRFDPVSNHRIAMLAEQTNGSVQLMEILLCSRSIKDGKNKMKGYVMCSKVQQDLGTYTLGLMHHEFIPEGRTVTKELYVETLRRLWDAVRRKRPEKWVENNWFLMHDNAPAHRAIIVKNFLARHNITALDHPPYSPDLSPPDYFLFPRLKSHLKGRRFNAEEVIANATRALRRVSQNGFQACFQELYTRWQKCVVAEGNYFEGNAVEYCLRAYSVDVIGGNEMVFWRDVSDDLL
ncbi:hypothetical protein ANN_05542 [Periplaneta americana]|uniref:Tc1-like transposase DDE domain-containing protein n=1 Tax=Periplaneta americana TaxID=6978 RepID=A0ABQ8TCX5_PERAM|nr:hypothetical protein ANN_05542 [Periplaneta americana]